MIEGWSVFRLPRSHWHVQLNNFDWASVKPRKLRDEIEKFVTEVVETGNAPHIVLTGLPGAGKSHIGIGVYRTAVALLGSELVTYLNVPKFCENIKRGYGSSDGGDPWDDIEAARRLVVLDDLFGRNLSTHEADHIVYRLIDTAYSNGAAVLVTMNPSVDQLASRLAGHETSRLLANARIIPMVASKDWRRS